MLGGGGGVKGGSEERGDEIEQGKGGFGVVGSKVWDS